MRRRCLGLSLVELMIAMALGVLVSAGIMAVFRATADSRQAQEQLARLQEEGRFAITQIKNDLFNAEFNNTAISGGSDLSNCNNILSQADALAAA